VRDKAKWRGIRVLGTYALAFVLAACSGTSGSPPQSAGARLVVLAAESFLADMAQNVAGSRIVVQSLIPSGVDPHGYEPTPGDVAKLASSSVLIINGAGLETFLAEMLDNAGGERLLIVASAGLTGRDSSPNHGEEDPHFWLNPINAVHYVENIRDGLAQADPAGAATYASNAERYIVELRDVDAWIEKQVQAVPESRRLLVTNHESLGYFADRYGFRVVGSIIPSVSTGSAPSARQLADLIDAVRAAGAPAVFLEMGGNAQLAQQLAQESGIRVVSELYTHSPGSAGGPAGGYIGMMKYNTTAIVNALRQ